MGDRRMGRPVTGRQDVTDERAWNRLRSNYTAPNPIRVVHPQEYHEAFIHYFSFFALMAACAAASRAMGTRKGLQET